MSTRSGKRASVRVRTTTGITALLAALVVALLPLPATTTPAQAADASRAAGSAVTVTGKKGKYDDFSSSRSPSTRPSSCAPRAYASAGPEPSPPRPASGTTTSS